MACLRHLSLALLFVPSALGSKDESGPILEEDITAQVIPGSTADLLKAGTYKHCPLKCSSYYAGASASSPFVAMVLPSGIGTFEASCYPPYGVGPPFTEDWKVCYQLSDDIRGVPKRNASWICEELMSEIGSIDAAGLGKTGAIGERSTNETTTGRWMKGNGDIGCGWGATLWHGLGGPGVSTNAWSVQQWVDAVGFQVKRWRKAVADERACCEYAMSFEGTPWEEGGSAVRFQHQAGSGMCHVDRETMVRGNLDRSSGLALRDTHSCSGGSLYWRHATGGADAANLKGGTLCQKNNGFSVLADSAASIFAPIGVLPDHFTNQWGNEFPNHKCANWPYGQCRGVIGYNTVASPEECCEACVNLKWVQLMGGDVSMQDDGDGGLVHSNPYVAWQVVGGKCRIMREEMVKEHPNFKGKTVRQAIETRAAGGATCIEQPAGTAVWNSERNCNYYSFARYRETFNVVRPATPRAPGAKNVSNATFSKVVLFDFLAAVGRNGSLEMVLKDLARNGTTDMLKINASVLSLPGTGRSSLISTILNGSFSQWIGSQIAKRDAGTCAKLHLFSSADMATLQDGSTSLQDPSAEPWCETEGCLSTGAMLVLECNVTKFLLKSVKAAKRRLRTLGAAGAHARQLNAAPKIALAFDGDGAGKDNMIFDSVRISRSVVALKRTAVGGATTKSSSATTAPSTSGAQANNTQMAGATTAATAPGTSGAQANSTQTAGATTTAASTAATGTSQVNGTLTFEVSSPAECANMQSTAGVAKLKEKIAAMAGSSVTAGQTAVMVTCARRRRLSDGRILAAKTKVSIRYEIKGMDRSMASSVKATMTGKKEADWKQTVEDAMVAAGKAKPTITGMSVVAPTLTDVVALTTSKAHRETAGTAGGARPRVALALTPPLMGLLIALRRTAA